MTASLDLWPVGNCQVSALIDNTGRFVWGCVPRVDGDPAFSSLLSDTPRDDEAAIGFWEIDLEGVTTTTQSYLRNTPILVTRHTDASGNTIEVIDYCPRFRRHGRMYRPLAFARHVRPVSGSPRIRVRLRPAHSWGAGAADLTRGSNHIRYIMAENTLRLTTTAPVGWIMDERLFRVERDLHFFLGPDEGFESDIVDTLETMLKRTIEEWQHWVRGLAIPVQWQEAVIRAAITLKLCQHEETGAIVAALTTSIPEHAGSGRNWDYRYCWIRDAYYTVQALNRLGALDVLEGYLEYLRNIVDNARGGQSAALRCRWRADTRSSAWHRRSRVIAAWGRCGSAIRPMSRSSTTPTGRSSSRTCRPSSISACSGWRGSRTFKALEPIGERAWTVYRQTGCRPLGVAHPQPCPHLFRRDVLGSLRPARQCRNRAGPRGAGAASGKRVPTSCAHRIEEAAWRPDLNSLSATFSGDDLDASLIQLLDLRFLAPDDPRFIGTLAAVEHGLRRGSTCCATTARMISACRQPPSMSAPSG